MTSQPPGGDSKGVESYSPLAWDGLIYDAVTPWNLGDPMRNLLYRVHSGLKIADGSDRGKVNITADYLGVEGVGFDTVSLTADLNVSGVNGLDTGAEAASKWYSLWAISTSRGEKLDSLLSLSATAPIRPAGYALQRRLGWVYNNSGGNLYRIFNAADDDWFWFNEDFTDSFFLLLNTTTPTTGSWTTITASLPSTLREILIVQGQQGVGSGHKGILTRPYASNWTNNFGSVITSADALQQNHGRGSVVVDASGRFDYRALRASIQSDITLIAYRDIR